MPVLKIEGVTHWSIPVNDLNEAEEFYGELLGLTAQGQAGQQHHVLLQRGRPQTYSCASAPPRSMAPSPRTEAPTIPSPYLPRPSMKPAALSAKETSGSTISPTGRGVSSLAASSTSTTPAATGWNSGTRPGPKGMPEPPFQELAKLAGSWRARDKSLLPLGEGWGEPASCSPRNCTCA